MSSSRFHSAPREARNVAVALVLTLWVAACAPAAEETAQPAPAGDTGALSAPAGASATMNPADSSLITVYKTPTCGCCALWVDHMRANGFRVAVTDVAQLAPVKTTHGVPGDVATCHTGKIGGYFVEGHVPAEDVRRMLRERPDIIGIAVPGMPQGSPGMEQGGVTESYDVIAIGRDGSRKVWASHGAGEGRPGGR